MARLADLKDLFECLVGRDIGSWYWVANADTFDCGQGRVFSSNMGCHPFVLVQPFSDGPVAVTRPRSTTSEMGIRHAGHPKDCLSSCQINKAGWVQPMWWTLPGASIRKENYSCQEYYPEILEKLRNGDNS